MVHDPALSSQPGLRTPVQSEPNMSLKSLLLSSDDKTVRTLRRVLSDLEIGVEHCSSAEAAIRKLTRVRFEAIIVDCSNAEEATRLEARLEFGPLEDWHGV